MKIRDKVSFNAKFKIDNTKPYDAFIYLNKLKDQLSVIDEPKVNVVYDNLVKRILVTSSTDTDNFAKELKEIDVQDISAKDHSILKSNLIGKYIDDAIEFGEEKCAELTTLVKQTLGLKK